MRFHKYRDDCDEHEKDRQERTEIARGREEGGLKTQLMGAEFGAKETQSPNVFKTVKSHEYGPAI